MTSERPVIALRDVTKVYGEGDTTVKALDAAGNPANNGVPPLKQIVILSVAITEA